MAGYIAVLFVSFILANISMVKGILVPIEASHRSVWIKSPPGLSEVFHTIWNTIIYGQYHSSAINSLPILFLFLYMLWKKMPKAKEVRVITIIIIAISVFDGVYDIISIALQDSIRLLTSFQFKRFTFLIPFLYTLILLVFNQSKRLGKWLLILVIGIYSAFSLANNAEFSYNLAKFIIPNHHKTKKLATFDSFYSKTLFKTIENYIGRPKEGYRVVNIGMHPSIAQYNGFYTLDSYQNNYPLSYKKEFRNIIKNELAKNETLLTKFDNWGIAAMFLALNWKKVAKQIAGKQIKNEIKALDLDIASLKRIGRQTN